MNVQASAPNHDIRHSAEEDRRFISIDVPPNRERTMTLTRRSGPAEGRTLSRTATRVAGAIALVTLATLLTGCHTTRVVWAKPGGNDTALQDDMRTCSYVQTTTATPSYQAAAGVPGYQSTRAMIGYSAAPMPAYSTSAYPTPAYSADATNSATIDAPDAQRSPVKCMIAHGWRLTPLP